MHKYLLACMLLATPLFLAAQAGDFQYGFKAGLNFATLMGELETDNAGNELEEFDYRNGFHVGANFSYFMTDMLGLRGELLYSQKGLRYRYEGPSFQTFFAESGNAIYSTGDKRISLNVSNSYVDIPVTVFARLTDWIEVSVGANVGFLVTSAAAGELIYSGRTAEGTTVDEFNITLDYNYFSDETQEADFSVSTPLILEGQSVILPGAIGAYYEIEREDGSFFNPLDLGLVGGLSLFLNESLFVAGRLNYGLNDVTNNDYDFSRISLDDNNELVPRADKDTNFSWQASIGFAF